MKRIMIFALAIILIAGLAQARVPRTMNVQGVLMDDSGNVMPDGDYMVAFMLWDMEFDGSDVWNEDVLVTQTDGYFSAVLGHFEDFQPDTFTRTLWLSMQVEGDSVMEPRIEMTSVASALSAGHVDRGGAVLSLNGLKNNVNLQGGANVTITQQDSTLVIAATAGEGGDDGDWTIADGNVYRPTGEVLVGVQPSLPKADMIPPLRGEENGERDPLTAKMTLLGDKEGFMSVMTDSDDLSDGRSAIFGRRMRTFENHGIGYTPNNSNTAITGYNDWGDSYTFGVAGYTWFDSPRTGGVIGSNNTGGYWGSLGYMDENSQLWGVYTPNNIYAGGISRTTLMQVIGLTDTGTLRVVEGATTGHVLTSDDVGNATWQAPGAGGSDTDWLINGDDVHHEVGRVLVGVGPAAGKAQVIPPMRGQEEGARDPITAKMTVKGSNEGLYSLMIDDNPTDGKAAIFGRRDRNVQNDGTSFAVNATNTAITGYNDYGDSYTFGVAGYTWFDFNNTGGVLGSRNFGDYWGALAFRDDVGAYWGMYTPNNLHVGGMTETTNLRMSNGASEGYIMTSDAEGNASWSPAGAAESDGDWTISGNDLYHSGVGTVALGTGVPHSWGESVTATTLQVKAFFSPTLALDAQGIYPNNDLHRWTMTGGSTGVQFNYSNDFSSYGTTAMLLKDTGIEFNDHNGDKMAELITYNGMDLGGSFQLFGPYSSIPTFSVDGHIGGGGSWMRLYNGNEQAQVTITGNHSSSGVGRVITPVLEITGGSDLSEQFDIGNTSGLTEPGMVVSIDPENPGQLTLSGESYDRKVAGVISGAGGVNTGMVMGQRGTVADGDLPVALVGRVYVWADASDGPIEPGDLLTTSDRPGHAMKVTDHGKAAGAILGKAMTGLEDGQGLILTLVSLQ